MHRAEIIARLKANPGISVLIIGGGINGAGTFRDLAFQDRDVLLVEQGDFCSGASAASSHMAHGGIRYLENREFRLVREAVAERNRLLRNAPQHVRPLPTVIPIFRLFSGLLNAPLKFLRLRDRPAERGAAVIKLGLMMYDAFTRGSGSLPRHRFQARTASLRRFPKLNPEVLATATYYDAFILHPERLCLELILETEANRPEAMALNYCRAVGIENGAVVLEDVANGERLTVEPRVVINAAGPWIDRTNRDLGTDTDFIGGTKGSHLVLDHPALRSAIGENEFFFENDDGRIVLICPYFDRVLVGTSDIPIDDPEDAVCTEAEVDYFLAMIGRVFPGIPVDRAAIVFRFSGVRPLPRQAAATTGQISRDHHIELLPPDTDRPFPVFSLIGGKWTTYRAFAEQAAALALHWLGVSAKTLTEDLPIGNGRGYPKDPPVYSIPEIDTIAREEKVVHLDDLLLRRTLLGMLGRLNRSLIDELAGAAAHALGWDESRRTAEIDRALRILRERHQVEAAG